MTVTIQAGEIHNEPKNQHIRNALRSRTCRDGQMVRSGQTRAQKSSKDTTNGRRIPTRNRQGRYTQMTNMRKTTIVISFPSDEMPIEKVEEIVKMIQRFTKSNLREQGGHTASENFRQEHMSDIVCMEDHEQWWYPDRFGHNDPKISVQFTY